MTSKATFGDFLDAAQAQLAKIDFPEGGEDLRDASQAVRHVVLVLARYTKDIASGFGTRRGKEQRPTGAWGLAVADVQGELDAAAQDLQLLQTVARTNRGVRPSTGLASRMDRAAAQLRTGRELLETHFTSAADGTRQHHSELAAVLASPVLRWALLIEIGDVAMQAAHQTRQVTQAPGWRSALVPRRALSAVSRHLQLAGDAVVRAWQREPLPARYRDLLYAIHGSMLPPSRMPGLDDGFDVLRDGAIEAALRARRANWHAAAAPAAPVTITSLREAAAAGVLTSHHCEILLRAAGDMAAIYFPGPEASHEIEQAAIAVGRCRERWLSVAHALSSLTTENRGKVTDAAHKASAVAMWTGRLAYADPAWTLTSGPAQEQRSARALAPTLADIPKIIATVHHAIDTLVPAAAVERRHAAEAASAGHLLVPSVSAYEAGRPTVVPAPDHRVDELLDGYREAGNAGGNAAAAVSQVATSVASPSRHLTSARQIVGHQPQCDPTAKLEPLRRGPLEFSMRDRGITNPRFIQRAIALDHATEQLMLDAAAEPGENYDSTSAETLGRFPHRAAVAHSVLESRESRAEALLKRRQPQYEAPDREP